MYRRVGLGLVGCGTVGAELLRLIGEQHAVLRERHGIDLEVRRVALGARESPPPAIGAAAVAATASDVFADPEVETVIELVGETKAAFDTARRALNAGKNLVTADRSLLAAHAAELLDLAHQSGVQLRFEAAVGAAVPIAGTLTGALAATRVQAITAILSGPSNFVLSRMMLDRMSLGEAVALAQSRGLITGDARFEVQGQAAAQKLAVIAALAFGVQLGAGEIPTEGIAGIGAEDIAGAARFDYVIRLLGVAKSGAEGVELRVSPALVPRGTFLAMVQDDFTAFLVAGEATGDIVLIGRDTGAGAAASAILADALEIAARGSAPQSAPSFAWRWGERRLAPAEGVTTGYYLRFPVRDEPGVIGKLATVLGEHGINIDSAQARESSDRSGGIVEILTRRARAGDLTQALGALAGAPVILGTPRVLRIEEWLPAGGYFAVGGSGAGAAGKSASR